MTEFKFKTYRCEWVTEVFTVDQYDRRERNAEVWYEAPWATREEALADLERISFPDPHGSRRKYPESKHGYYACEVRYREVEIK